MVTATHRTMCTERYMFLCGEKAYVLCFCFEPILKAVGGSVRKQRLQDCLLSSTWDGNAGSRSQEMGEQRAKWTGVGETDVTPGSNPN